jgi:hypothetical protein
MQANKLSILAPTVASVISKSVKKIWKKRTGVKRDTFFRNNFLFPNIAQINI